MVVSQYYDVLRDVFRIVPINGHARTLEYLGTRWVPEGIPPSDYIYVAPTNVTGRTKRRASGRRRGS